MEWQLVVLIAITACALVGFVVAGRFSRPSVQKDRDAQDFEPMNLVPGQRADSETVRRFTEALKSQH